MAAGNPASLHNLGKVEFSQRLFRQGNFKESEIIAPKRLSKTVKCYGYDRINAFIRNRPKRNQFTNIKLKHLTDHKTIYIGHTMGRI
ncbi:MAG: hypothetical protein ACI9OT_002147 [Gammaproteobacteria bacterium]|jgi:hypothetical protein